MEKKKRYPFLVGVLTNGARSVFLGSATNPASRAFVTKKNTVDATKKTTQKTVPLGTGAPGRASRTTGPQLRDLTALLLRLRDRELARQEKRQTGKHLHDSNIKGFSKTIDLLKNLLQHGYNPGRYTYDEKDFSYSRPVRTLTAAQREKNLDNLEIARAAKEKKAAQTRLNNDT